MYLGILAAGAMLFAPPAHAAATANPCDLLSLGEAQSVTHLSLTPADPNPMRAGGQDADTTCGYLNDKSQSVSVVLHDDPAFFPGNAKNPNTTGFKRVNGIGQRAWSNAMAIGATIEVLKNGRYVSVRVANPDGLKDRGARNYSEAIQLAKVVAKRL